MKRKLFLFLTVLASIVFLACHPNSIYDLVKNGAHLDNSYGGGNYPGYTPGDDPEYNPGGGTWDDDTEYTDDMLDYNWSGYGTEAQPYIITTAAQLRAFAVFVNNGDGNVCAKLDADIDLNPGMFVSGVNSSYTKWIPIGISSSSCYSGTFDGNFHTITGLYINGKYSDAGFFGYIKGGTVKNLCLSQGYIKNTYTNTDDSASTGAIVGSINNGTIISCANEGVTVDGNAGFTGGLVGLVSKTYIKNSYNRAIIQGENDSYSSVGGIAGICGNTYIINCYNAGTVSGYEPADIVGYYVAEDSEGNYTFVNFEYCYYKSRLYGEGKGTATEQNCAQFSSPTATFSGGWLSNATLLNNLDTCATYKSWRGWKKGSDGYPTLFY